MKKITYSILVAALALVACKKTPEITIPDDQKEKISFSMSDSQGASSVRTKAGFVTETGLLMHIQSDNNQTDATEHKFTRTQAVARVQTGTGDAAYSNVEFSGVAYNRYWDDAHGRDSWLSVYAVAVPGYSLGATALGESKLSAPESGTWGTTDATVHTIQWTVKQDGQTSDTNAKEDLVYARNIQKDGEDGLYWYQYTNNDGSDVGSWQPGNKNSVDEAKTGATTHGGKTSLGDGRMTFRLSNTGDASSAGKFDRGHLKFNHALSRLTIKLVEGTGFAKTEEATDFNFDDGKSYVQINNANYTGTLNLVDGKWGSISAGAVKLTPSSKTTPEDKISYYTLNAQILPDNVWNGAAASPANVFEFFIDGNHYFVTEAQLYNALIAAKKAGDVAMTADELTAAGIDNTNKKVTLKQGVNYNLQITVDKKQIETITAVLADWSEVYAANENIDNSHITINTHKDANGMADGSTHQLYLKTEDLGAIFTDESYYNNTNNKGYEYSGTYSKNQAPNVDGGKWKTSWFYEDNKTAYHIRSVNNSAHTNMQNTSSGNTYFTIANGSYAADGGHDYHWGAPLKTGLPTVASGTDAGKTKYEYSPTDGYKNLLYPGVTAVKSGDINITELHMMSNIEVIVRTTTASNAVALEKTEDDVTTQCEVTLTRLYSAGQVDLGTGKITETGVATGDSVMDKPEKGTPAGTNVTIDGTEYSTIQTKPYSVAVVPQILYRGSETTVAGIAADAESKFVGITIKTPDNNQYYVVKHLQDIKPTSIGTSANQGAADPIKRWYPNHKYIYTITVTKAGIKNITCTLADWSVVTGENINIDLED